MITLEKAIPIVKKPSIPTRYPGVTTDGAGSYRLRGKGKHLKTGKLVVLDQIVSARSPLEASQLRTKLLAERRAANPEGGATRVTLKAHALSWLASKLPSLKPSTQALYATLIDEYIVEGVIDEAGTKLGDCYVDVLTLDDLVFWRDHQINTPTKYGRPPAASSVNGRITKLKEIIRAAVHDLRLERDPTLRLEPVREGKKRRNSLSAPELQRFLTAAHQHCPQWYPFFFALAFSGMRFGELTNLRWKDIDKEAGCIRLDGAHWKGIEDTTKNDDQDPEPLPLFPELVEVLELQRENQLELKRKRAKRERVSNIAALEIGEDELVFMAPRSKKHMHNTAPRKALAKCLKAAGIDRRFTIHGHRHTFNNLLRKHTKDVVLVQSMTRHATVEMSERYSDVGLDEKREAVQGLRLIVGGKDNTLELPAKSGDQSGDQAVSMVAHSPKS